MLSKSAAAENILALYRTAGSLKTDIGQNIFTLQTMPVDQINLSKLFEGRRTTYRDKRRTSARLGCVNLPFQGDSNC